MKQELINHFAGWYLDLQIHPENYYLVLTDDMDSFYSCRFLSKRFGIKIGGFYKFGEGVYLTEDAKNSNKQPIYVDCSVVKDGVMCFDNHRCVLTNHMVINPNLINDRWDDYGYSGKYCGGTLMFLCALYCGDYFSELEKEFMLAVDSFFVGWYRADGRFREVNETWLDLLEMPDLRRILNEHDYKYFQNLIAKYQLKEKIDIIDGHLVTYADILPHDKFYLEVPTKNRIVHKSELVQMEIKNNIYNAAEVYKGVYICDFEQKGEKR